MSLVKRLQVELIGEIEAAEDNIYSTEEGTQLWRYNEGNKATRNSLRYKQTDNLEATASHIEADLKGLFQPIESDSNVKLGNSRPLKERQLKRAAYNQALADVAAAIERYCREDKA